MVLAQFALFLFIGVAPPPPLVERIPAPRHGYVWAPGHWEWNGRRHVWVDGRWIRERPGYRWVAPEWRPDGDRYGFTIRNVARRLRDAPAIERDMPRSVEQLTELVGRVSLKDIVRESTDLVERLCIEAAIAYTSDNRASAAEILGVSRQSLYSKLHRHGLGNLVSGGE